MEHFGLSHAGFKPKDFKTIKEELEQQLQQDVDPTLSFGPDSVAGVLTGIVANQARQVWESLQGLFNAWQPHTASGSALDALCSLTGTFRMQEQKSRVMVALTLAPQARIPQNSRIKTLSGASFVIQHEVVNDGPNQQIIKTEAAADEAGPLVAHAGSEASITTPVTGWSRAEFKDMIFIGRLQETDDELRIRRLGELKAKGSSTCDAIKERLYQIPQVEAVLIKESNRSFEVVIKGGDDHYIAQALWHAKPLGVDTTGTTAVGIKDALDQERVINFSRPLILELKLHAKVVTKQALTDQEKNTIRYALADYAKKHFGLGGVVYPSQFYRVLLAQEGILDVKTLSVLDKASGKEPSKDVKPEQLFFLPFGNIVIEGVW